MKKCISILPAVGLIGCLSQVAHAEFGFNVGVSSNCKVSFENASYAIEPRATDPGTDPDISGAQDRYYDDGTVLTDDIPGASGVTRFYAIDSLSTQVAGSDGGSITMTSTELLLDEGEYKEEQDPDLSLELYWKTEIVENETWSVDFRSAFRWCHVDFDVTDSQSTTYDIITDTYTFDAGAFTALQSDSYDNLDASHTGYPSINDTPTRVTTQEAGSDVTIKRSLDADVFALDIGPALTFDLTEKLSLTASLGGTMAYVCSEFSYVDGSLDGSDSDGELLYGWYVNADLQYQCSERWGISAGAGFYDMGTYTHEIDEHSASLDFEDYYTLRLGVYYQFMSSDDLQ